MSAFWDKRHAIDDAELRRRIDSLNAMIPRLEQQLRELSKINEGLIEELEWATLRIKELQGEKEALWSLIEQEIGN